ncbi:dipeptide epimerase [Chitinophaga sp.]|uniref:dipeptide epimerase n=1 Tax=Chitinophaga sp. TaxID=1869181 RepID=UPI0031D46B35
MLQLSYKPYLLQLKRVFTIARGSRSSAPLILTRLTFGGQEGFGEASMPALYGESFESAAAFLSQVDLSQFSSPFETDTILQYVNNIAPGNQAVKASIDIALHDLVGKLLNVPLHQYFGLPAQVMDTSMTIGIDSPAEMAQRAQEHASFQYLKIKLGTTNDRDMINAIRSVSDAPLFIDANQGWKDREEALDMIGWLKEKGAVFIEQPMLKENKKDLAWLRLHSPLPIIGDEGIQRLTDLREAPDLYHGINIKLMKSTGLREGFKMAITAKALGLKVMLGCMSETSCAISAAAQLGALADWVDLDGNLDAQNDPYKGAFVTSGQLHTTGKPGLGLENTNWDAIVPCSIN